MRDYVGRNAASFSKLNNGYSVDKYLHGELRLEFTTKDGSYVDTSDLDVLKQYIIVGQNIVPNEKIDFVYNTDSDGNEYSFVKSQSIEAITLTIEKIDGNR